ncbi:hypothetical protein Cgig2_012953 [Carnegiea gigantea]|uniref:Uncharacterized protein n=1 Tax=Carnegiea gigantea TaxID=171969 RepID=A0A9Q1GKC4_9CARY|nr:hypothetical protein Cgig2_012953 [Carnegiea gigantea]
MHVVEENMGTCISRQTTCNKYVGTRMGLGERIFPLLEVAVIKPGVSNRRYARIGDVIVDVIKKKAILSKHLERSEVIRAVIIHICKKLKCDNHTIANIITSLRNADMNREGRVRKTSTRTTKNINFTWNANCNAFDLSRYNEESGSLTRKN